jgi:hypothetical protein
MKSSNDEGAPSKGYEDCGFHRPQSLAALPQAGLEVTIEAKPEERNTLARFLNVLEIRKLKGKFVLHRWRAQGVLVTGKVEGTVVQSCVVTLEPVSTHFSAAVERTFLPEAMLGRDVDPHELVIDPEGKDPPEPLPHHLDLGAIAAEEMALGLDPYPRKSGAVLPGEAILGHPTDNPFSALKGLTGKT